MKQSLYNQFSTNGEKESNGVWQEVLKLEDGRKVRFKLSRMGKSNKKYNKALNVATKPHKRAIQLETMNTELAEEIFMAVFIKTIVMDWENVVDQDGNDLEFNKANATKLFTDLPELYETLQEFANDISIFKDAELEDDAGN